MTDMAGEVPPKLTTAGRLSLLERDSRSHARSLTEIIHSLGKGFTPEQMEQLRTAFREELADAGLRIDGPDHIDDAREDFRFLRRLRQSYDGAAKSLGGYVLLALFGLAVTIAGLGFWAWIAKGGR